MKSHFVLALAVANFALTQAFSQAPAPSANAGLPWGEPLEGVSVRLRADKAKWTTNETPAFKLDVRNQGQREFYAVQSQVTGRLEVDGVWYDWTGGTNLKLSPLSPGREYYNIPVSLGINWKATQEWRDKTQAPPLQIPLKLLPGKHTIRFAPEIRDITVKPKPQNNYVPSNPVEIETWSNLKNLAEASHIISPEMGTNSSPKDIEAAKIQGAATATKDIKAGELRILYFGQPWSNGKPLVDEATGYRVQIVAGCIVSNQFVAEVEAYNKTMHDWHAKTKKTEPAKKP